MNSEPGALNPQSADLTGKFNKNVATKTGEIRVFLNFNRDSQQ
jgi:hypothetical protein